MVCLNIDPKEEHFCLTINTLVPDPYLPSISALRADYSAKENISTGSFSSCAPASRDAMRLKRAEWKNLSLRQTWADEGFIRSYLRAVGLQVKYYFEPATAIRLKRLLRSVGVMGLETLESVGTSITGFLSMHPRLPLCAALALVLEATGRFAIK